MDIASLLSILNDRYEYREECGGLVYRKWFNGLPLNKVGERVGAPNPKGYRVLRICGEFYREHQLVWLLFHKELVVGSKEKLIDHKDNDTDNCKIDNLRVTTQRENCRNRVNQETPNISKTPNNSYSVYMDFDGKRVLIATVGSVEYGRFILSKLKDMGETKENAIVLKQRYKGGKVKNKSIIIGDMAND